MKPTAELLKEYGIGESGIFEAAGEKWQAVEFRNPKNGDYITYGSDTWHVRDEFTYVGPRLICRKVKPVKRWVLGCMGAIAAFSGDDIIERVDKDGTVWTGRLENCYASWTGHEDTPISESEYNRLKAERTKPAKKPLTLGEVPVGAVAIYAERHVLVVDQNMTHTIVGRESVPNFTQVTGWLWPVELHEKKALRTE